MSSRCSRSSTGSCVTNPAPRDYSRSRAVLIGTSKYTDLTAIPAAANSLRRMHRLLTGPLCEWPRNRVEVITDRRQPGDLPDRLIDLYSQARDVALFYYVGHGQLDEEDELCLALVDSRRQAERRAATSLAFSQVRRALKASPANTKIVILDCCYSGQATRSSMGGSVGVIDRTVGTGAFTMAACGRFNAALFEDDPAAAHPQTFFTKYLADVVEQGIPDRPAYLDLRTIFGRAAEELARDGKPAPERSIRQEADRFPFARNAAPQRSHLDPMSELTRLRQEIAESEARAATMLADAEKHARKPDDPAITSPPVRAEQSPTPANGSDKNLAETLGKAHWSRRRVLAIGGASVLAAGGSAGFYIFDRTPPLKPTAVLTDVLQLPQSVAFTTGGLLVVGGANFTARLYDVSNPAHPVLVSRAPGGNVPRVTSIALSRDDKTLVVSTRGLIQLWDVAVPSKPAKLGTALNAPSDTVSTALSPDGLTLASASELFVPLWDLSVPSQPKNLPDAYMPSQSYQMQSVAFSPVGHTLAASGWSSSVALWDSTKPDQLVQLADFATGQTGIIFATVFSLDGGTLTTAAGDGSFRLWSLANRSHPAPLCQRVHICDSVLGALALGSDGRTLAAGCSDHQVRLCNITNPAQPILSNVLTGHTDEVTSVAFSPDGHHLASGGRDGTVLLWTLNIS
jgi:WD40 repeat protein